MKRLLIAALGIGVFAALCRDASTRLAEAHPSLWICNGDPLKHFGKPIWLLPSPVVESRPGYFAVLYWGEWVHVYSPRQPSVGARVMVYGTFQSPYTVQAITWAEEKGFAVKRWGVLVVSMLVLAAGGIVFHRTFAWRDGAFHTRQEA